MRKIIAYKKTEFEEIIEEITAQRIGKRVILANFQNNVLKIEFEEDLTDAEEENIRKILLDKKFKKVESIK